MLETGCHAVTNFPYKLEEIIESKQALRLFPKFARKIGREPVQSKGALKRLSQSDKFGAKIRNFFKSFVEERLQEQNLQKNDLLFVANSLRARS